MKSSQNRGGHGYNRDQVNDVMITTPKRGIDKGKKTLNGHWYYYLYDLAFQKYVVEKIISRL